MAVFLSKVRIDRKAVRRVLAEAEAVSYMNGVGDGLAQVTKTILQAHRSNKNHAHAADHVSSRARILRGIANAQITVAVPHAVVLHNGSAPHRINPRNDVLRFFWRKAGRRWIGHWPPPDGAKNWADHPGTQGIQYFPRACARFGLPFRPRG